MTIRKTLLAAALAAFAFAALPGMAGAEVTGAHVEFWETPERHFTIDQDEGVKPVLSTAELEVSCTSYSGTGSFENSTTGTLQITFHGCKSFSIFNCTTPGQTTGTIVTTELPFHVEPVEGEPGLLISPNEGHLATFACFGIKTVVEGNGVIGTITEPGWTERTEEATLLFSQTGGAQNHPTTDTSEESFDLVANRGGIKETAALSGASTLTFSEEVELIDTGEATGAHVKFWETPERHFTIDQDEGVKPVLSTAELEVSCTSYSGTGSFENSTTGTLQITFHGCKSFSIFNCTTPGQTTGTIVTTELPFHVEPVEGEPGLLISPNEGHLATFACFGIKTVVEGNGVIGTITEPGWTERTEEATLLFSQTGGAQNHPTTDTSEESFDLVANRGGIKETAALSGASTLTFSEEVELIDTGEVTP